MKLWKLFAVAAIACLALDGQASSTVENFTNDATVGTSYWGLVSLGTQGRVVGTALTATDGVIGICTSGCGVDGAAQVTVAGVVPCRFDGATTLKDWVQISSTVARGCHDAGATTPTSGQIIGFVLSTNAAAGTYLVQLQFRGGGGGGGSVIDSAQGIVATLNGDGSYTIQVDSTDVPRYFTGSGAPAIICTAGRDFYTDTTGLNQYFCDALNTWKQTNGSSSRTDVQNWYVNSRASGGAMAFSEFDGTSVGFGVISMTGPNSISYSIDVNLFSATSATDSMMFAKKASHTWSAAVGTVDVNYVFWNYDGGNSGSTYTMKIYVGCSISGAAFSYGAASTVSVPNPGSSLPVQFGATPALPGNCAADASMQFWIQRTDTQAGRIGMEKAEVVIRGN